MRKRINSGSPPPSNLQHEQNNPNNPLTAGPVLFSRQQHRHLSDVDIEHHGHESASLLETSTTCDNSSWWNSLEVTWNMLKVTIVTYCRRYNSCCGGYYPTKKGPLRLQWCSLALVAVFSFSCLTMLWGKMTQKSGIVYYKYKYDKGHVGKKIKTILSPEDLASPQYSSLSQNFSKSTSFAVVINTYRRPDMLKLSLNHWVNTCGRDASSSTKIARVYVVWAELDQIPPKPEDIIPGYHPSTTPKVTFLRVSKDSLNSRFLPIPELAVSLEAVFMVDDDVRVDCNAMWEGFEAWRHHPNALVGFYPRLSSPSLGFFKSKTQRVYHTWPVVFGRQKFNIILTKASFFHKKYLDMYHNDDENPKEVLDYVDDHKNCEDIAMAFLVARKSQWSSSKDGMIQQQYCADCPVYVRGKIEDQGLFNGISTSGGSLAPSGHMEKRSMCLDALTEIYKKRGWEYPLVDVSLSDQSWVHTYWWLNAPSNIYEWFSFGNTLM